MQKFDEEHARNMIKYFYPEVSRQVVILPLINKEMNTEEYNLLLPHIAQTWLIENHTYDQSCFTEVKPNEFLEKYNELYGTAN
jgi:DNA sulfur modification protein DndD